VLQIWSSNDHTNELWWISDTLPPTPIVDIAAAEIGFNFAAFNRWKWE
jgi:hypothetical protein